MRTRLVLAATVAGLALVAAGCGSDDSADKASGNGVRTVNIEMRDIAFSPEHITVPAGDEVRLVFHNTGKVDHDAYLGDDMAQADHEAEMKDDAGMHHGGDNEAITVKPGKTGTLTHTFKRGDDMIIGCHQPGHYASGMKIAISVT